MIELFPSCFFVCHLILRCNYSCSYCIQKHDERDQHSIYQYQPQPLEFWTTALPNFRGHDIYFSGGEITLLGEDYVAEVVKAVLGNFNTITIGTNLACNIDKLLELLPRDRSIIFGVSYQHEYANREHFLQKLRKISSCGYRVIPTMLTENPSWRGDDLFFRSNGYQFMINPYQGFKDGIIYPVEFKPYGGREYKKKVICYTSIRAVAPDGVVYPCAHLAYTKSPINFGLLSEVTQEAFNGDLICDQYGWCNPCCTQRITIKQIL